eukprot:1306056-Prymnesium_polylepis.1
MATSAGRAGAVQRPATGSAAQGSSASPATAAAGRRARQVRRPLRSRRAAPTAAPPPPRAACPMRSTWPGARAVHGVKVVAYTQKRIRPAGRVACEQKLSRERVARLRDAARLAERRQEEQQVALRILEQQRVRQPAEQRAGALRAQPAHHQSWVLAGVEASDAVRALLEDKRKAQPRHLQQLKARVSAAWHKFPALAVHCRPEQHVAQVLYLLKELHQPRKGGVGRRIDAAEQPARLGTTWSACIVERGAPHDCLAISEDHVELIGVAHGRARFAHLRVTPLAQQVAIRALPKVVRLEQSLGQQPTQQVVGQPGLLAHPLHERPGDDDRWRRDLQISHLPSTPVRLWDRVQCDCPVGRAQAPIRVRCVLELAIPPAAVRHELVHVDRGRLPQHHKLLDKHFEHQLGLLRVGALDPRVK